MPRGGDDLASTDEVKVYKDEGDDENRASQNLSEDKRELVIETEEVSVMIRVTCRVFLVSLIQVSIQPLWSAAYPMHE
jgi:N-terminal CTNNB1 binding